MRVVFVVDVVSGVDVDAIVVDVDVGVVVFI
jgi:hypothetical protein